MAPKIIVAGLPDSGKTTYIIALRYVLLSDEVPTLLEQTKLSDNESHFNALEEKWLAAERVTRTQRPTEAWVALHVRDRATGKTADLIIPDLKGEHFEEPAMRGFCDKTLYHALADSTGILLFVNADTPEDDLLISDIDAVISAIGDGIDSEGAPQDAGEAPTPSTAPSDAGIQKTKDFDPGEMPSDAKLVEFLQMVNRRPLSKRRRRLGLIVSAWDEVSDPLTPSTWVEQKHPMLFQFLKFNPELWEVEFYGVSAQGGELPRDKERLKNIPKPSMRVEIVGGGARQHDLTAPIQWLMSS